MLAMNQPIDPQQFIDTMLPVVQQCAKASMIFYGQAPDIGKNADASLTGSEAQEASSVFTALDSGLQDILLSVVLQHFPKVRCIAEEHTPLKRRFAGNRSLDTVILDPIDGSLHFREGDAPYHISIGLARNGQMQAAIIARPNEDKLFTSVRGQGAFLREGNKSPRRILLGREPRSKVIFISSKARRYRAFVPSFLITREHPIGAALILTQLAEGELCAYLTCQVETYDVGPPSLIAEEAGAHCFLKNGCSPLYCRRRKFNHYLAAANGELAATLLAILRAGAQGGRG